MVLEQLDIHMQPHAKTSQNTDLTSATQINSKCITDMQNNKRLRDSTEETWVWLYIFTKLKTRLMIERIDKLDFIKIQNFYFVKTLPRE